MTRSWGDDELDAHLRLLPGIGRPHGRPPARRRPRPGPDATEPEKLAALIAEAQELIGDAWMAVRALRAIVRRAELLGAPGPWTDTVRPPAAGGRILASCGHMADDDGQCSCAWWPERAPLEAL